MLILNVGVPEYDLVVGFELVTKCYNLPHGFGITLSWKWMVGRLVLYWEGNFSGAMLNFLGVMSDLITKSFSSHDKRNEVSGNPLLWGGAFMMYRQLGELQIRL